MSYILEMKHITKQFPGVLANHDVTLQVETGAVHTLLGENGAGKSTLMNILCGLYKPTAGEIYVEGKRQVFSSAKDAMAIGIGMVHQHFMLIPRFSVVDNCLIGLGGENPLRLGKAAAAEKIAALAAQYNMDVDPYAVVGTLSVGQRQRVEIIKALFRGAKILILDEPTAVLTPQEAGELFKMIRHLTQNGYTILFISHKLNEVLEISDKVTVLRLGKVVGNCDIKECSVQMLARMMVDRDVLFTTEKADMAHDKTVLRVQGLTLDQGKHSGVKLLDGISFDLHAGEILGVAGVDGNGQSELGECLTGRQKATSGSALYQDIDLVQCSTRQIMDSGVSHIPQDRQSTGLALTMNLTENFILQDYYKESFGKGAFLDWKHAQGYSQRLIRDFHVKTPGPFELAKNLSGGNQQKVIVAREISRTPKLLIAMHPTRGLDVGAVEYIHKRFMEQRELGMAILLISTELDEILKISDRICVMYEGRIMGVVRPRETTVEELGLMMGGTRLEDIRHIPA